MTLLLDFGVAALRGLCVGVVISIQASVAANPAPIIQPGAPGQPSRELSAEEAVRIAVTRFSPADVRFMQDMIPHHHQALVMSDLAPERTNRPELLEAARRIRASQADEIEFMQNWLSERGQRVPDPAEHAAMHADHGMAGMATPVQLEELAAARGTDFDRLFLTLMIRHHEGAVKMVEELLEQPGSAFDPVLYEFTTSVTNDQIAEIEKMNVMLLSLSSDPRAQLAAGFDDAGEAILNLRHVARLPRPVGFYDPENPTELPPSRADADADADAQVDADEHAHDHGHAHAMGDDDADIDAGGDEEDKSAGPADRYPLRSFSNTDMAFRGDILAAGSYHGFNLYRLGKDGIPELLSSVVCPGGQGDVSIVGDLLLMSVEEQRARLDCGLDGIFEEVSAERLRGLRIFDISDLKRPVQVGAVQTCRGSHTHTVVSGPDEDGRIIVYNSGTASIRKAEELPGCIDELPGDQRTALFRIDVIEIPVDAPEKARVIDSPAVFADPESGVLAGLWRGGDHGDETQATSSTNHCHDITVFPDLDIAAGACSGNGILFDISDPLRPRRIHEVVDTGFAYWHSATFSNDGTKVIFTDEWGGGMRPRCRAHDPVTWGANAIYDIVDGKLEFRSYFKIPAPQTDQENCVAHNGSIVPVPARDLFVQAWYQGGITVIDFTDSANPIEIAYFDRGPIDPKHLVLGGYWSAYYYKGRIYGTEIVRGLDVFELLPSEHLSANEIAAAELAEQGAAFNPQQQSRVHWPVEPVVARAYLDQLIRAQAIPETLAAELAAELDTVAGSLDSARSDSASLARLRSLATQVRNTADGASASQIEGLARTLEKLANRL